MKDKTSGPESRNSQPLTQGNGAKKKVRIRRLEKIETTALNGSGG